MSSVRVKAFNVVREPFILACWGAGWHSRSPPKGAVACKGIGPGGRDPPSGLSHGADHRLEGLSSLPRAVGVIDGDGAGGAVDPDVVGAALCLGCPGQRHRQQQAPNSLFCLRSLVSHRSGHESAAGAVYVCPFILTPHPSICKGIPPCCPPPAPPSRDWSFQTKNC